MLSKQSGSWIWMPRGEAGCWGPCLLPLYASALSQLTGSCQPPRWSRMPRGEAGCFWGGRVCLSLSLGVVSSARKRHDCKRPSNACSWFLVCADHKAHVLCPTERGICVRIVSRVKRCTPPFPHMHPHTLSPCTRNIYCFTSHKSQTTDCVSHPC